MGKFLTSYVCLCVFLTSYFDEEISRKKKHNGEGERPKGCNLVHKYRLSFMLLHDSLVLSGKKEHRTQI